MCPVVRFEVGALGVGFAAAHVVAGVRGHPLPGPGAPTALRLGFLRQAVPAGDQEGLCGMERVGSQHGGKEGSQKVASSEAEGSRTKQPEQKTQENKLRNV